MLHLFLGIFQFRLIGVVKIQDYLLWENARL